MPRSIDLFVHAPLDLGEMAAEITRLTGLPFAEAADRTRMVLDAGDTTAVLAEHDFIDDRDLLFSRYRYVLTATVASDRSINDSPQAVLLRQVFSALKADQRFPSLLVFDLQHLVERTDATTPQERAQ